jgi:hypothetical protein
MNSNYLANILHILIFLSDGLFWSLKIFIPVIFILSLFRKNSNEKLINYIILSLNNMLLIAGLFFLFTIITNTTMAWYNQNEFEKQIIISSIQGPKWYQYVIPTFNFALLPNILWFKKIRSSIYFSFCIVLFWIITSNIVGYLSKEKEYILASHAEQNSFSLSEHYGHLVIFFVGFCLVFPLVRKMNNSTG